MNLIRSRMWRTAVLGALLVAGAVVVSAPAGATTPTPPYTQCPAAGQFTSCLELLIINPDGTVTATGPDPAQAGASSVDGIDDALIGVQNNMSQTVSTVPLTAVSTNNIFAFDGDGLCGPTAANKPAACPFGPTFYEGPNTSFTITDLQTGAVNFLNGGLAPGGSAYFTLEHFYHPAGTTVVPPCTGTSTISAKFNATPIAAGNVIWFNAVGKFKNIPTNTKTTLFITGQTITYPSAPGTKTLPDTTVIFDNTVTTASTTFAANTWTTRVPATYTGNVFIGGGFIPVPDGPPGGSNPVAWTATFALAKGVTVDGWKWAAAVYPGTPAKANGTAGAKPVDGNNPASNPLANNGDHAGTPENVKTSVVGGARGGGGSNYTGSYSGTAKLACPTAKGETLLYYHTSEGPPQPAGGTATTVYYADDSAIGATTVSFDGVAGAVVVAPSSVQTLTPLVVIGGSVSTTKNEQSITFTPPVGTCSVSLLTHDTDGDQELFTWTLC